MTEIATHLIDAIKHETIAVRLLAYGSVFAISLTILIRSITALLNRFSSAHTEAKTVITAVAIFTASRMRLTAFLLLVVFAVLLFFEASSSMPVTRWAAFVVAVITGICIVLLVYLIVEIAWMIVVRRFRKESGLDVPPA